jgi:hypothetical protein
LGGGTRVSGQPGAVDSLLHQPRGIGLFDKLAELIESCGLPLCNHMPTMRPAPYLASRGMKWIQHFARPGLSDDALRDYIRQSHFIVSQGLSKKKRIELGLVRP